MTRVGPTLDWRLGLALALLLAIAVTVAHLGRLPTIRQSVVASVRAALQLLIVAGVIRLALEYVWTAAAFAGVMFSVATATSSGRIGARPAWPWVGAAIAAGVAPTLAVVFATGASPASPSAVVAICGIVIGNAMNACSLAGRRAFASLRDEVGQVEAALSLGFLRRDAIRLVVERGLPEALVPVLDQTRTVGLVTLPGAFVGVLLGGGSTAEAAAAQVLVLVGLVATETITVVVAGRLVAAGRLLPTELSERLPAA